MISRRLARVQAAKASFNRFVILLNPASTHAKQVQKRIDELRRLYPETPIDTIETSPSGMKATQKRLAAKRSWLGPGTLLCIGGGDGTAGTTIQTLLQHPELSSSVRSTPILPLWGGNANDLAHMLNGAAYRTRLRDVFAHGQIVPIHPLECRLTYKDGRREMHNAICYASFGATAFVAKKLSRAEHRNHPIGKLPGGRFLLEFITAFSAMLDAPTFRVEERGQPRAVYERTFSNGSRFAKIYRMRVNLTDNMFYLHTLEDKRFVSLLPRMVELSQKRLAERFLHDRASFTVTEPTQAQFDGEYIEIPAGTKVYVQLSPQPFYALSTLLTEK